MNEINHIDEVKFLLKNRPVTLTLTKISTENDISIPWLNSFLAGSIKNPSYNRIIKLHSYLKENYVKI